MQKTAELFPDEADAHYNLGVALAAEEKFAEAEEAYRRALRLAPDYVEAQVNLGNVLAEQGRHAEAEACCRRVLEFVPDSADAHNNLGNALKEQERHDEAEASYRRALELNPHYADAHDNLGVVFIAQGKFAEAEKCFREALALDPDHAKAHNHLGVALDELGRHDEAEASFRRALTFKPDFAEAHLNLSHTLKTVGRTAEAEASLRRTLELAPQHAGALAAMGNLLYDQGQFAEAEEWFRRALEINPKMPGPWSSLAHLRKMTADDADWLKTAEEILHDKLTSEQESALRYSMGKFCDDTKDYDRAFTNYHRGNELKKTFGEAYDREANARKVDRLMGDYSAAWLNRIHPGAADSARPLIIVGMPRSGTSLTEQIIASHPATFGAGELHFWGDVARRLDPTAALSDLDEKLLRIVADECLQNLDRFSADALRVVDKMPGNFYNVGLIHTVFPNARILHTQRNPIDNCLSIYFQNFNTGHTYASDLDDLAHYYREYHRLMAHWRAVLPPEVFLDVPYEALVEDQEGWSRRIIEFIGLEWSDSCLNFHETERKVGTASNWQVRQKIYKSSKERWRNYEKHVGPLLELLELYQPVIAR
jgi:tetratricopeptide (TPR) repeat protein